MIFLIFNDFGGLLRIVAKPVLVLGSSLGSGLDPCVLPCSNPAGDANVTLGKSLFIVAVWPFTYEPFLGQ